MKIKPLADRVLVEPAQAETQLPQELLFLIQHKKNHKKEPSLPLEMAKRRTANGQR